MKYIALLRGIGPGDPRMTNEKLRGVFESLGFTGVKSIISSGNIIFSTDAMPSEQVVEAAITKQLGFTCAVIIRSEDDINYLLKLKPFGELTHAPTSYTLVTFLKNRQFHVPFDVPLDLPGGASRIIGYDKKTSAIFSVTDQAAIKTPMVMAWLEKQLGKDITSRTWNTIGRISKKFLDL